MSDRDGGAARYRDFSEMPSDVLRSLTRAMDAISRGEKLNDVLARTAARTSQGGASDMPVTRADELDARSADNAKELLALAGKYEQSITTMRAMGRPTPAEYQMIIDALRLSARQQASVEWERLTSTIRPLIESVCSDGGSDAARLAKAISDALLAKYDIFEKVEG